MKKRRSTAWLVGALVSLSACSSDLPGMITIHLPKADAVLFPGSGIGREAVSPPASAGAFDCYSVNVTGTGISFQDLSQAAAASFFPSGSPRLNRSAGCQNWPAITSPFATATSGSVALQIPRGTARTFSMVGFQNAIGGPKCAAGQDVGAYLKGTAGNLLPNTYLLGSTTTDITGNTALTIANSYSPTNPSVAFQCNPPSYYFYAVQSGGLIAYKFDPTIGSMTQVGSSIIVSSNTLAVHPGGKYVYVLDISGSAIYWYNISPTDGSLSAVGTVSSLSGLKGLAVDPTGTYLYTTDSTPALKVFKIQSDGGITSSSPVAQATFTNQSSITRSVVSPNGKNLFYPTGNTSGMNVFGLNNLDGALISAGGSAISDAAFDPTSTYAYYGVNAAPPNLSACTLQYSSPNTGNVTGCGAVNVSVSVTALALSPTGNFLFAGSAGPAITSFAVSGGTTLTQVGSAFSISNTPQFLAVDPTGKYLIAGLAGSNYKIYSIGTDGSLSGPLSSFGGFPGGMAFVTLY